MCFSLSSSAVDTLWFPLRDNPIPWSQSHPYQPTSNLPARSQIASHLEMANLRCLPSTYPNCDTLDSPYLNLVISISLRSSSLANTISGKPTSQERSMRGEREYIFLFPFVVIITSSIYCYQPQFAKPVSWERRGVTAGEIGELILDLAGWRDHIWIGKGGDTFPKWERKQKRSAREVRMRSR